MFTGIIEEIGHAKVIGITGHKKERRQQFLQYRQKKSLRVHI